MLQDESANLQNLDSQERLEDADAVLHALGLSASLSRASTAPSNVSSMDQSRLHAQSPDMASTISQQPQQASQFSSSLNDSFVLQQHQSTPKSYVPLEVVHVNQINIPPKERVYYTKSTQTPAPINVPQVPSDSASPQGDATQQKSYYGKQTTTNTIPLQPAVVQQPPQSPSTTSSLSNNTQVAGINQLALEWDDEFPGMLRLQYCLLGDVERGRSS